MFWLDWRELEKHNDWGVRDKDDATAALWNDGAEQWEKRSAGEVGFAQKQVDALTRITKETMVLDVCCGTGPLTLPLAKKARQVTAFDFNEKMLDFVRRKAAEAGADNIDYLRGNFNTIVPGEDFQPAEIAVTRHSPAQGNILKFSRFATKYCYSLALAAENPEVKYVTDVRKLTAPTKEALAEAVFPVSGDTEILRWVERHARPAPEGWELLRPQTMAVIGWDPSEIRWDLVEKLGIDW